MGLDLRLIRVGVEIEGAIQYYSGMYITARGTKYGNANPNECKVQIDNLTRAHRDYLLTETSPFNTNRTPKKLIIEAGRVSYGYSLLFVGNITTCGISQPPDIGLTLNALTGYATTGQVVQVSLPGQSKLSTIAAKAALDNGLALNFQAQDKNVANYGFTGVASQHIAKLGELGGIDAFVDNDTLIVKDADAPLPGTTRILNLHTGMVGIPELTEQGIRVKMLLDTTTTVGTQLEISSVLNPSINGRYLVCGLAFDISTRENQFYYIAECKRLN